MVQAEYILGIDYGAQRVGVAIAHATARLPRPLQTLSNDSELFDNLQKIITDEGVCCVVVGVPRNMDGSLSQQSSTCEAFTKELAARTAVPVETFDETLSSVEAEAALKRLGKPYDKADIDAVAAQFILERYFTENRSEDTPHEI